jgi:predicted phage baseplate assembly protein
MSTIIPASTVFAASGSDCCSQPASAPQVPAVISNAPGRSAIEYRSGTFTSFRRAMLDRIAFPDLMAGAVTSLTQDVQLIDTSIAILDAGAFPGAAPFRIKIGTEYMLVTGVAGATLWTVTRGSPATAHPAGDAVVLTPANPFGGWHEGIDADYQTMFVELWAYLADVLTFYQERIANEAFLQTATQRDSLLRLVGLIDYHPSPGAGAGGLVAFTAAKDQSLTVPSGFRVGSRAQPGKPAVVFETAAAIAATGDNSVIPVALLGPDVDYDTQSIVLQGVNHGLSVNDYLLAVENESAGDEARHLLRITAVTASKAANTTTVAWQDVSGVYEQASKTVALYAFRLSVAPLGDTAPRWDAISPTLTNTDHQHPNPPYPINWDLPFTLSFSEFSIFFPIPILTLNQWFYLPIPGDATNGLFLDSVYGALKYSATNPGWAVLLTDGDMFQIFHVTDARQTGKVAYSITTKATRLTFVEPVTPFTFPLRNTTVLTGNERLPLQIDLPLDDPLSGAIVVLTGIHTQLQDGQTVVLRGNLFDPLTNVATDQAAAESAVIDGAPEPDPVNNVTLVNLKHPLAHQYVRATCSLLANIVEVTQGETVKDEVLGGGDGAAFQSFALKKSPLTYLPSADPEGLSAVQSSLRVTVDGVAWIERPNLVESAPHDQDFTTSLDDAGDTIVVFGDGFNGARPPTGVGNIHARYRRGLGKSGNLPSGGIQQLVDSNPNLLKVTNPMPSSGGDDPASAAAIRTQAPGSLQTFGRAVSVADYAALALRYPGVAKAGATWVVQDPVTLQAVPHPYVQLTVGTNDRVPFQGTILSNKLRGFLDNHRDPNVPLRVQDFTPVYIEVALQVEIDARHPHQGTLNQVQAALNPGVTADGAPGYFAFEQLKFGQPIFLSALYAVLQSIAGVNEVTITRLRRVGPGLADALSIPPHDILVGPTEIVTIDSAANPDSVLTITGHGGFVDV